MRLTDRCSITAGTVDADGNAMIAVINDGLAEQRVQHSIPLTRRNGAWRGLTSDKVLPFLTAGIAPLGQRGDRFSIVGWGGQALATTGLETAREGIFRDGAPSAVLRSVAEIGGQPHAVGMRRQVYRRVSEGHWSSLDSGIVEAPDDRFFGFEAIDGLGTGELYAAGIDGDLWVARNDDWQRIESPTNVHLHAVACAPDGVAFAGGRMGVLLSGRGQDWTVLETGFDETIWALCWFANALFVFSEEGVYRRDEDGFTRQDNELLAGEAFYKVGRSGTQMWCFARKKIVVFDGRDWQSDDCLLAEPIDPELLGFFDDDVLRNGSDLLPDD